MSSRGKIRRNSSLENTRRLLGYSREQALRRLLSNEKALARQGTLDQFREGITENLEIDHGVLVPPQDLHKYSSQTYYLPMHGVVKYSSSTTKLRIVFDISARSSSTRSLNDSLLPGPCNYPLIPNHLLRFIHHRVAMTADVSKMPNEWDYHWFIICQDPGGPLVNARMKRLTFRVTLSPFLATSVLCQVVQDHQDEFPRAAQVIKDDFYVDDCLMGTTIELEAIQLCQELCQQLGRAQMTLRKWSTNSSTV